jgi:hypothetical protein
MMAIHPPKTLQMVIKENWLVESIKNLGSGYYTHLVYSIHDIDPEVRGDIEDPGIRGVLGEIIKLDRASSRRVAVAEVNQVNDFHSFIRFDLRLLEITPFIKELSREIKPSYLCYYYHS